MTPEKENNHLETVPAFLTMAEWNTVLHWLQYGADYHNCKKYEWLANCHDKKMGAEHAALHEKESKEAETLRKFIEDSIMGPQPQKPEEPQQPAMWIWDESPETDFNGYMCAKCGWKYNHEYYANVYEFNFCPHCGHPHKGATE